MPDSHTSGDSDPWELLHRYRERYDIAEDLAPALRLERTMARRQAKAHTLQRRVTELETQLNDVNEELRASQAEVAGSQVAAFLAVDELLKRVRIEHGEGWSPTPVLGFRMWVVRDNTVHGAMTRWRTPRMTAQCLNAVRGSDIPHPVRTCGPPACGIYATKRLEVLRRELGIGNVNGYVIGVVALRGKVVEHDLGYRAARGEVVAAATRLSRRQLLTSDSDVIARLFRDPTSTTTREGSDVLPPTDKIDEYLNQWKEKQDTWTWETKSESSK